MCGLVFFIVLTVFLSFFFSVIRSLQTNDSDSYEELLRWMKKKFNFKSNTLQVANFPQTGRGIAAKKSICPGKL